MMKIFVLCSILPLIASCVNSITGTSFENQGTRPFAPRASMISGRLTGSQRLAGRQTTSRAFQDDEDHFFDDLFPSRHDEQPELVQEFLESRIPSLESIDIPSNVGREALLDELRIKWKFSPINGALLLFEASSVFYHSADYVSIDFYACPSSIGWYTVAQALGRSGGVCHRMGHEEIAAVSYQRIDMRFDGELMMDQQYANAVLNSLTIVAVLSKPDLHPKKKFYIASPSVKFIDGNFYKIPREPLDYQRLVFLTPPKTVQEATDILRPPVYNIQNVRERYSEMRLALNNVMTDRIETVADADTNPFYVLGKSDRRAALNRIKQALEILEEYFYYNPSQ